MWPAIRSSSEGWYRVNWRLLEEEFLEWYIWLKDNFVEMKKFVEEVKDAFAQN